MPSQPTASPELLAQLQRERALIAGESAELVETRPDGRGQRGRDIQRPPASSHPRQMILAGAQRATPAARRPTLLLGAWFRRSHLSNG